MLKTLSLIGLLLLLVACSDDSARQQQSTALAARAVALEDQLRTFNTQPTGDKSGLLVQLAFGVEADLDLYVTDPLLETVYFANKAGKSGGKINGDRRCEDQPLRVEEVYFPAPLNGSYRIGVDYPNRCSDKDAAEFAQRAAYTLSVLHNGKRQYINGTVGFRFFEVAAFDFIIDTQYGEEQLHEPTTQ